MRSEVSAGYQKIMAAAQASAAQLRAAIAATQVQFAADIESLRPEAPPPTPLGFPLAKLKVGEPDERNRLVLRFLAEAADRYIVYRAINAPKLADKWREKRHQDANSRVCVHLSDNPETRALQVDNLSQVSDLRTKVGGLINGRWRDPYFERAFAEALGMAAEFDVTKARVRLSELLLELEQESLRIGQAYQMAFSCAAWAAFLAILFVFSDLLYPFKEVSTNVWLAAKGGATGALFSIATMFNKRALAPDTKKVRIALEAVIRVGSGVIAAGALLLALTSGIFTRPIGGEAGVAIANWMYVVVIGFLAGFVERLVPDLFDKVQLDPTNKQGSGVGGVVGDGGGRSAGGGAGTGTGGKAPTAAPPPSALAPGGVGQTGGTADTPTGSRVPSATSITQSRIGAPDRAQTVAAATAGPVAQSQLAAASPSPAVPVPSAGGAPPAAAPAPAPSTGGSESGG